MNLPSEKEVLEALSGVADPMTGQSIINSRMVKNLRVEEKQVDFDLLFKK